MNAGQRHHRARYADEIVEQARARHDNGEPPYRISAALNIPRDTLNDWLYYRTRTRLAP